MAVSGVLTKNPRVNTQISNDRADASSNGSTASVASTTIVALNLPALKEPGLGGRAAVDAKGFEERTRSAIESNVLQFLQSSSGLPEQKNYSNWYACLKDIHTCINACLKTYGFKVYSIDIVGGKALHCCDIVRAEKLNDIDLRLHVVPMDASGFSISHADILKIPKQIIDEMKKIFLGVASRSYFSKLSTELMYEPWVTVQYQQQEIPLDISIKFPILKRDQERQSYVLSGLSPEQERQQFPHARHLGESIVLSLFDWHLDKPSLLITSSFPEDNFNRAYAAALRGDLILPEVLPPSDVLFDFLRKSIQNPEFIVLPSDYLKLRQSFENYCRNVLYGNFCANINIRLQRLEERTRDKYVERLKQLEAVCVASPHDELRKFLGIVVPSEPVSCEHMGQKPVVLVPKEMGVLPKSNEKKRNASFQALNTDKPSEEVKQKFRELDLEEKLLCIQNYRRLWCLAEIEKDSLEESHKKIILDVLQSLTKISTFELSIVQKLEQWFDFDIICAYVLKVTSLDLKQACSFFDMLTHISEDQKIHFLKCAYEKIKNKKEKINILNHVFALGTNVTESFLFFIAEALCFDVLIPEKWIEVLSDKQWQSILVYLNTFERCMLALEYRMKHQKLGAFVSCSRLILKHPSFQKESVLQSIQKICKEYNVNLFSVDSTSDDMQSLLDLFDEYAQYSDLNDFLVRNASKARTNSKNQLLSFGFDALLDAELSQEHANFVLESMMRRENLSLDERCFLLNQILENDWACSRVSVEFICHLFKLMICSDDVSRAFKLLNSILSSKLDKCKKESIEEYLNDYFKHNNQYDFVVWFDVISRVCGVQFVLKKIQVSSKLHENSVEQYLYHVLKMPNKDFLIEIINIIFQFKVQEKSKLIWCLVENYFEEFKKIQDIAIFERILSLFRHCLNKNQSSVLDKYIIFLNATEKLWNRQDNYISDDEVFILKHCIPYLFDAKNQDLVLKRMRCRAGFASEQRTAIGSVYWLPSSPAELVEYCCDILNNFNKKSKDKKSLEILEFCMQKIGNIFCEKYLSAEFSSEEYLNAIAVFSEHVLNMVQRDVEQSRMIAKCMQPVFQEMVSLFFLKTQATLLLNSRCLFVVSKVLYRLQILHDEQEFSNFVGRTVYSWSKKELFDFRTLYFDLFSKEISQNIVNSRLLTEERSSDCFGSILSIMQSAEDVAQKMNQSYEVLRKTLHDVCLEYRPCDRTRRNILKSPKLHEIVMAWSFLFDISSESYAEENSKFAREMSQYYSTLMPELSIYFMVVWVSKFKRNIQFQDVEDFCIVNDFCIDMRTSLKIIQDLSTAYLRISSKEDLFADIGFTMIITVSNKICRGVLKTFTQFMRYDIDVIRDVFVQLERMHKDCSGHYKKLGCQNNVTDQSIEIHQIYLDALKRYLQHPSQEIFEEEFNFSKFDFFWDGLDRIRSWLWS